MFTSDGWCEMKGGDYQFNSDVMLLVDQVYTLLEHEPVSFVDKYSMQNM